MATCTWVDNNEYTSGTTNQFIKTWPLNGLSGVNIPRYSTISKVTFSVESKQNLSLSSGNIQAFLTFFKDDVTGDDVVQILSLQKNAVKNRYKTFSSTVTHLFETSGADVGRLKPIVSSEYGRLSPAYIVTDNHATVIRKHSVKNVTLKFEYNDQYNISTNVSPSGTGSVSGGGTKTAATTITLTANPSAGYEFTQWSDGNTSNPRNVLVTGNATYTAQFTKKSYTITVSGTNGTVTGGGTYQHGSTATLTATPNSGYRFVKWSDENTSNPRTITVSGNATYTAVFEKITFIATFKNHDGTVLQTVSVEHGGTPKYTGSTPTKPSTAEYSYSFSGWNPSIGAITSNITYTAQFTATKRKYTINTSATNGVVSGGGTYEYGTSIILIANPADGYKFEKWSDGNTQNPRVITVTGNVTYEAQFRRLVLKFKTVKIYYPSENNIASPTNPLISGEKAQMIVQVALE